MTESPNSLWQSLHRLNFHGKNISFNWIRSKLIPQSPVPKINLQHRPAIFRSVCLTKKVCRFSIQRIQNPSTLLFVPRVWDLRRPATSRQLQPMENIARFNRWQISPCRIQTIQTDLVNTTEEDLVTFLGHRLRLKTCELADGCLAVPGPDQWLQLEGELLAMEPRFEATNWRQDGNSFPVAGPAAVQSKQSNVCAENNNKRNYSKHMDTTRSQMVKKLYNCSVPVLCRSESCVEPSERPSDGTLSDTSQRQVW